MIEALFHIATRADWDAAKASGEYTTSTRGRTLAEEGFIHASTREQVAGVFKRYYANLTEPLVLLRIDPRKLDADVRLEKVGTERYPHIYGPIPVGAVATVISLNEKGRTESFTSVFVKEMLTRVGLAFGAMALAFIVALLLEPQGEMAQFLGAVGGLLVGIVLAVLVNRRLNRV